MQKKVVFQKPTPLDNNDPLIKHKDNIGYLFRFSYVDTSLVGKPEEKSVTSYHKLKIAISEDWQENWNLSRNDLIKVLFECGKRYIEKKVGDNKMLSKTEELLLPTDDCPPNIHSRDCPFDLSRIPEPDGFTFLITIDDSHDQLNENLRQAYDLLTEKLGRLRKAWAIESDPAVKFKLEEQIKETEQEIKQIEDKMSGKF